MSQCPERVDYYVVTPPKQLRHRIGRMFEHTLEHMAFAEPVKDVHVSDQVTAKTSEKIPSEELQQHPLFLKKRRFYDELDNDMLLDQEMEVAATSDDRKPDVFSRIFSCTFNTDAQEGQVDETLVGLWPWFDY